MIRSAFLIAASLAIGCGSAPEAAPEAPDPQESPTVQLPDFDTEWNFGDPVATEARFRAILAEAGPDAPADYRLQIETQIARCQSLRRDFAAAHATLDAVGRALADMAPDALPVVDIRRLLERGRAFNSAGDKDAARPLFVQAWQKARAVGADGFAVDAAHMVAIVEPPEAALGWNQKALALAEGSPDPAAQKWLGALYNNIGWTHHDAGRHSEALATFRTALAWREARGKSGPTRIAKWSVARALRSLDRTAEALAMQTALEAELTAAGEEDGFVYEELGELHLMLGDAEAARGWFAKAHPLLAAMPWVAEQHPERLVRIAKLGGLP